MDSQNSHRISHILTVLSKLAETNKFSSVGDQQMSESQPRWPKYVFFTIEPSLLFGSHIRMSESVEPVKTIPLNLFIANEVNALFEVSLEIGPAKLEREFNFEDIILKTYNRNF
jgi:hypothetical protein